MEFISILYIIVALILLWKGADLLVDSAAKIAFTLGVSQLVIGLTVVAFGTSAPEFVVTINAALKGQSNISISNVIGSNIFNLG
ncbi:MAG: sodium:calcium antiporter, partial [Calditrichia bacterium]|nr:sodium:calcium antiporter [Calditrichia bacterium]